MRNLEHTALVLPVLANCTVGYVDQIQQDNPKIAVCYINLTLFYVESRSWAFINLINAMAEKYATLYFDFYLFFLV